MLTNRALSYVAAAAILAALASPPQGVASRSTDPAPGRTSVVATPTDAAGPPGERAPASRR